MFGVGTTTIERARVVWHAAHHGPAQAVARHLLDRLDEGDITASTAHRLWAEARDSADPRGIIAARLKDPNRQRDALQQAAGQLAGLTHVLDQVNPIHSDISSQEAATLLPEYVEASKALDRLIKRIKDRSRHE
jgi:hypothetical protein